MRIRIHNAHSAKSATHETMALADLNRTAADANAQEPDSALFQSLLYCCGSHRWVANLLHLFPVSDFDALCRASDEAEKGMTREDWLEAFAAHPRVRCEDEMIPPLLDYLVI